MTDANVIDETFAGLVSPAEVHSMGRPDIESGRPGEILVDEVKKFEAEGGFKEIARIRAEERLKDDDAGPATERRELPDFGIKAPAGEARDLEAGRDSGDEK